MVKIAAISPQFLVEPPPGDETEQAKKTVADLRLVSERPAATSAADTHPDANPEAKRKLSDETLAGLRRLSKVIGGAKKKKAGIEDSRERRKRRQLALYQDVARAKDPREGQGDNVDDYI